MCRISSFVAESDHESAGSQVPEQQHLGAVHPADALQGTRDSAWLSTAGSYPVPAGCLSPPQESELQRGSLLFASLSLGLLYH